MNNPRMSIPQYKEQLFDHIARIGKAISAPVRLQILEFLTRRSASVEDIAQHCQQSVANVSRHLQALKGANLVIFARMGKQIIYSLADPEITPFMRSLKHLAHNRLLELEQITRNFFDENPELKPLQDQDIQRLAASEDTLLIDVRPRGEYDDSHVPGALNVPIEEIDRFAQDCDPSKRIIAYCRGPYCTMALEAVSQLRQKGIEAAFVRQLPLEDEKNPEDPQDPSFR